MQILLTNDDGIYAKGLECLHEALQSPPTLLHSEHKCTVVAPLHERSAISHAITLREPLRVKEHKPNWFSVTGTPTDACYVGVHKLLPDGLPDIVLSGINHGPNLGIDVLYSGTVAAALEAARCEIPAIALSFVHFSPSEEDWQIAKKVVQDLFVWLQDFLPSIPPGRILNVNIPGQPVTPTQFRITTLGRVDYPPDVTECLDPHGKPYYWIGGKRPHWEIDPSTDCGAVQEGIVSITPLQLDLTDHNFKQQLEASIQNTSTVIK